MPNSPLPHAPAPGPAAARWLAPSDAFFAALLALPQLACAEESCVAERALHAALQAAPTRVVEARAIDAIEDADARDNYATFIAFRDALLAAGTLEAYYLALMRGGNTQVAPLFVDRVVAAIVDDLLAAGSDVFEQRAGELLHRSQRLAVSEGRVVCGDREAVDLMEQTGGFGELGRLLRQGDAPLRRAGLPVLTAENAAAWQPHGTGPAFLLDLTHEISNDVGHGLSFTMTRAHSGLRALARLLERWIERFFAVRTRIVPLQRIDDAAWSWHIGLDTEATALLNELWRGEVPALDREGRLIGLFRLEFESAAEMRADLAGKPVYLGLAMTEAQTLKLKPQNLLLDLPLAASM